MSTADDDRGAWAPAAFAAEGSPADCVLAGLYDVLTDNPPDLVLSGREPREQRRGERALFRHRRRREWRRRCRVCPPSRCRNTNGPRQRDARRSLRGPRRSMARVSCASCSTPDTGTRPDYRVFYNVNFPPLPRRRGPRHPASRSQGPKPAGDPSQRGTAGRPQRSPLPVGQGRTAGRAETGTRAPTRTPISRLHLGHAAAGRPDRPWGTGLQALRSAIEMTPEDATRKMQFLFQLRLQGGDGQPRAEGDGGDRPRRLRAGPFRRPAPYEDMPLPIASGQNDQPALCRGADDPGNLGAAARHRAGDRTGSGYQAAILSELARRRSTPSTAPHLTREAEIRFTQDGP